MSNPSNKLRSCPFCGGNAEADGPKEKIIAGFKIARVGCKNCGVSTPNFYTQDEAIHFWNNRAGWIDVNEQLPKERQLVMLYEAADDPNMDRIRVGYYGLPSDSPPEKPEFYIVISGVDSYPTIGVTHWMPLPDPPTMDEEERLTTSTPPQPPTS